MEPKYFVKNLEVLNLDPMLVTIAAWASDRFHLFIVTSAYRPGDSGVHGTMPVRGLDLRCSDDYTGKKVEAAVNMRWGYDDERPAMNVCIYHDVGKGKHIHLQVSRNTYKKGPPEASIRGTNQRMAI